MNSFTRLTKIISALLYVLPTLIAIAVIELAQRADIKLPLPFMILLIGVLFSGWKGGTLAAGISGFTTALYVIYLHKFNYLPSLFPDTELRVFAGALVFPAAALLIAYTRSQKTRELETSRLHDAQLKQQENIYQTLAEATQDVVARYDRGLRHTYVNSAITQLSGKQPSEYLGKTMKELGIPVDRYERYEKAIDNVFASARPAAFIAEEQDQNGATKVIDWRLFPEFDCHGNVESVIKVSRDITERRSFEKKHQELKNIETLGILAAGIAHDFNNILTVMFGNIALLKETLDDKHPGHEYINEAEEAFQRASNLTKEVLSFSKDEALVKEPLRIEELVAKVAHFDLSASNIKLDFHAQSGLWPLAADKVKVEQIFSNLTTNACQAMPAGGTLYIRIMNVDFRRRKRGEHLKQIKYVKITIQDEGAGIERKNIEHIFDPYFSTKATGNGLGLATVYSNILKHEGYIGVKSEPGKGTTFSVFLPAIEEPSVAQANQETATELTKAKAY